MEMMSVVDKNGRDENDIGTPEKDDGKGSPDATCERQGGTAREIWATSGRSGLSILYRAKASSKRCSRERSAGGGLACLLDKTLCALWPPSQNAIHPPVHQSIPPSLQPSSCQPSTSKEVDFNPSPRRAGPNNQQITAGTAKVLPLYQPIALPSPMI